jgi:hypothetical protein
MAEAAQIGTSLAGLAERYITQGSVHVEASGAPQALHPVLIAELKRIGNNLNQIAHAVNANLPPDVESAVTALRELIRLILRDEILSQRVHNLQGSTANDSTSSRARDEFQRIVHVHPARSAGDEP